MVRYDPSVIRQFADMLYARAAAVVLTCMVIGAAGGFVVGCMAGGVMYLLATSMKLSALGGFAGLGCTAVGTIVGAYMGRNTGLARAFVLKLEAQTALCQAQIEKNTRPPKALTESAEGAAA